MNEHYQAEDWLLIHSYYDTIREGLTDSSGALVPGTMSERQHMALCALDDVRTLAFKYFEMAKAHRPHILSEDCWCNPRVEEVLPS